MKTFKGKAIYTPVGKAREYAKWACNFYVGCSNACDYCYLKKGRGKHVMGGDEPKLKKCYRDESHALEIFEKELKANLTELRKHGLFFSFTTDPMLDETQVLTMNAAGIAVNHGVCVKILTKNASWVENFIWWINNSNSDNAELEWRKNYAFGFTLTGHDEREPGASTNAERIAVMRKLKESGFKTFASIEPVINYSSSLKVIYGSCDCCDLYKIGLESGRAYDKHELQQFVRNVYMIRENYNGTLQSGEEIKVYFKNSLLKKACIERSDLPDNCVTSDFNIFNNRA